MPLDGALAPPVAAWHVASSMVREARLTFLSWLPPWIIASVQRINSSTSFRILARYFQFQQLCTTVHSVHCCTVAQQKSGFLLIPVLALLWASCPAWVACTAHAALTLRATGWWPALLSWGGLVWAAYDDPPLDGLWSFWSLGWLQGSVHPALWLCLEVFLATIKCFAALCTAGMLCFLCNTLIVAQLHGTREKSSPAVAALISTWILVRLFKGSTLFLLVNTSAQYLLPFTCAWRLVFFRSPRDFVLHAAVLLLWGFSWAAVVTLAYNLAGLCVVLLGVVLELTVLVLWRANHPCKWSGAMILSSVWTACLWCGQLPPTLDAGRCLVEVLRSLPLLVPPIAELLKRHRIPTGDSWATFQLSLREAFVATTLPVLLGSYVGYRRHKHPVESATPLLGDDSDSDGTVGSLSATSPLVIRSMSAAVGRTRSSVHRTFSDLRRTHSAIDTVAAAADLERGSSGQPNSLPPGIRRLAHHIVSSLLFDFDFRHLEAGATVQEDTTFSVTPSTNTKRRSEDLAERLPPAVITWKLERGPLKGRLVLRQRGLWRLWALLEEADTAVIDFLALKALGGPKVSFEVDRADLLHTGMAALKTMDGSALLASEISVTFKEEQGVDAGGLRREFFTQFALELTDVDRPNAIFSIAADNTVIPRPTTVEDPPPDLEAYRLAGRFLGLSIMQGYSIPIHFHGIIYKMMTRQRVTLGDVKSLNPEFFQNRFELLLLPDGVRRMEEALCEELTFVSAVTPRRPVPVPLMAGGEHRRVTEDNKREYLELLATHYVEGGVQAQRVQLLEGFHEVIPIEVLRGLEVTARDLEVLLAGTLDVDLDEWRAHTTVEAEGEREQMVAEWFWECVEDMDADQHSRLLAFTTGLRRLPPSGFQGLSFKLSFDGDANHLPTAHTCFQNLVLPLCESKEDLMAKLKVVLQDDALVGFGFI